MANIGNIAGTAVALSVVVPCFNEAAVIGELHKRATDACRREIGQSYEIILVNDGSNDGSREAIFHLAETDAHTVGIDLERFLTRIPLGAQYFVRATKPSA